MGALAQQLALDQQTVLMLLAAAVLGALLGGALAHWRRGSGMIATGAIIGAIALPLLGLAAIYYAVFAGALAILALAVLVLNGVLG